MASAAPALQSVLALEVDPGLGGNIDPAEWEVVRRACRAEVLRVPRGPWPLNHELLGRLIGARRPTVTIALRDLETGGGVRRRADGSWLLTRAAEGMINAIARSPGFTHSIGERMMLYRELAEATAQTRARRAEAGQIHSQLPRRARVSR